MERCSSKKSVTASGKLLDYVHLDKGAVFQIRACLGRGNVEKEEVIVVPDANRSFRRKIRLTVRRHSRGEAEVRRLDHGAHVGSDGSHCMSVMTLDLLVRATFASQPAD